MDCPLCTEASQLFYEESRRRFFDCPHCRLVFLGRDLLLGLQEERARYSSHKNTLTNPGYRKFLLRLVEPLRERIEKNSVGLDFGCGPTEAMKELFQEFGFSVASFDPHFFPDRMVLKSRYDFILLSEVVEHFREPRKEFSLLKDLIKPKGWIAVSTAVLRNDADFPSWYYKNDPTHVNFFREETLKWLAGYLGWDVELRRDSVSLFRA